MKKRVLSVCLAALMAAGSSLSVGAASLKDTILGDGKNTTPAAIVVPTDIDVKASSGAYANSASVVNVIPATFDIKATVDLSKVREKFASYVSYAENKGFSQADIDAQPVQGRFTINVTYSKGITLPSAITADSKAMEGFSNKADSAFTEVSRAVDASDPSVNKLTIVLAVKDGMKASTLAANDKRYLADFSFECTGAQVSAYGNYEVCGTAEGFTHIGAVTGDATKADAEAAVGTLNFIFRQKEDPQGTSTAIQPVVISVSQSSGNKKPNTGVPTTPSNGTVTNPDGSTTTTTTNPSTGTVTETTTNTDGSTTTVETKTDGTVTTVEKDNAGTTTTTVENADGTVTSEETRKDGTTIKSETAADGNTKAEINADGETSAVIPVPDTDKVVMVVVTDEEGNTQYITNPETKDGGVVVSTNGNATVEVKNGEKREFEDVHPVSHWSKEAVDFVNAMGIMNGTSEKTFSPDENLTRGMLVAILYRAAGESEGLNKSIPFSDVSADQYYAKAVIWAAQNGIVTGTTENTFEPDADITREQVATIIYRYAQYLGLDVDAGEDFEVSFEDSDSVADYAVNAIKYMLKTGLLKGKTDTTINPGDTTTRAEIATIFERFIKSN